MRLIEAAIVKLGMVGGGKDAGDVPPSTKRGNDDGREWKERDMTMAAKREEQTVSMLMALTGEAWGVCIPPWRGITPRKKEKAYLDNANPLNRSVQGLTKKYAKTMLAGFWYLHHQGIDFDESGNA